MCGRGRGRYRKRESVSTFPKEMEKVEEVPGKLDQKTGDDLDVKVKKNEKLALPSPSVSEEEDEDDYVPRGLTFQVAERLVIDDNDNDPIQKFVKEMKKKDEEEEKQRTRQIVERVATKIFNWQLRCERELTGKVSFGRWGERFVKEEEDQILRRDLARTRVKRELVNPTQQPLLKLNPKKK